MILKRCEVTYVSTSDKLRIGEILLYPTQMYRIKDYANRRITMDETHRLLNRIQDIEV